MEPIKNEKLAKKKKLRKYIKKIKIQNLKGDEELTQANTKFLDNAQDNKADQTPELSSNSKDNMENENQTINKTNLNNPFKKQNIKVEKDLTQKVNKSDFNTSPVKGSDQKAEFSQNTNENLENGNQQTNKTNLNNPFRKS